MIVGGLYSFAVFAAAFSVSYGSHLDETLWWYMELGDFVHARLFVFVLSGWLLLVFCFIFLFGLVSYMLLLLACCGDMLMILFLSLSVSCFLLFSCDVADSPGWWMEGQGGRNY